MSVLVTGATGLIGTGLVRLLSKNHEQDIVAFHRNPAKKNLNDLADRIHLVHGDLGIFSHVMETVAKYRPVVIYHLGAMLTAPSNADPPGSFQSNVAGTFHILEAARLFEVKQVVFASSIGTYGSDVHGTIVDDDTPQHPASMYGVGKLFGEGLGQYYMTRYGLDFRCLRYPGIFGPGFRTPSHARIFSRMVEKSAMGLPHTIRLAPDVKHALLYYKDAAAAMVKLAQADEEDIRKKCYLLSGVEPIPTVGELVEMIRKRLPETRLNFDPDPELSKLYYEMPTFDDHYAREEWGWHPEYDMAQALDDFISEQSSHPEWFA